MQRVATYLLERRDGLHDAKARSAEYEGTKAEIRAWLDSKGASGSESGGSYQPEDGSSGTYRSQEVSDDSRKCWSVQVQEDSNDGRRFAVHISVLLLADRVTVYVFSEAGLRAEQVRPVSVDARCPRIVRNLLRLPGKWYHGTSTVESRRAVRGFDGGEMLVQEIRSEARALPLVVVSTTGLDLALPELDQKIEYDLTGLASVALIDEDASWALTDVLGAEWACYWGAVRLFWPGFDSGHDRFAHPLWTRERLTRLGRTPMESREQIRRQLRSLVFRASVLGVGRPQEIDAIRDSARNRAVVNLRERAQSLAEFKELADLYSAENDELREERDQLRLLNDELEAEVTQLESDKQALQAHLQAKSAGEDAWVGADSSDPSEDAAVAPRAGETRFYKKVHSRPGYDVLVRISDCGHSSWQNASKAEKAKKGIVRHENGRSDWKSVQHCGSCTGGGVWKVRW